MDFGAGKKPVALFKKIISMATSNTDSEVILDFFAGSGTSGHATYEMNSHDDGNRRFILVQIPEHTERTDFPTIPSMTKERLRRAGAKIKADNPNWQGDTGFRVFKLDTSNIRAWSPNPADLEAEIMAHQNHLLEGRSEADILYELLLKRGLDLCIPIEQRMIHGKTVYAIGGGVLMACLATTITRDEVESLAHGIISWHGELQPADDTTCVFRDSAFTDDVAKTNLAAILAQSGLQNVRSL
jgi:adenine-specific DNA-methyltransferase